MEVGFTGTREGMTKDQKQVVNDLLLITKATKVHSGDCIGADEEFHLIAKGLGILSKGHPPNKPDLRAFCEFDEIAPEKSYYARNRDIVTESGLLIATPKESSEQTKGGTWYTIGYAITVKRDYFIVWPNGSVKTFKF